MARINVETGLFIRGEWLELVVKTGSADTALGAIVRTWLVAQRFWFPDRRAIPKDVWQRERLNQAVIDCGLAELRDDGVYVRGSEEQFAWLFEASDKGKKGGQASAEKRKKTPKKPKHRSTTGEAQVDPGQAEVNLSEASSSLLSSLSSYLNSPISISQLKLGERDAARLYELSFAEYPIRVAGPKAFDRFCEQIQSYADARDLVQALNHYRSMLALPENSWRRPKQSFETFLGTKQSGFFWRDFISPDSAESHVQEPESGWFANVVGGAS